MDIVLDNMEVRILGCLIEKEITTPEYYPLSLNALTNACSQKSNRRPVLLVEESAVLKGLDGLRQKGLARETHTTGSRVTKYLHELLSLFDLSGPETAVLCELMLRGPQTPGELRSNAGRMAPFKSTDEIEETLRGMMEHAPPLVAKLQREPGKKESRYAHLFSPQSIDDNAAQDLGTGQMAPGAPSVESIARLEDEVRRIRIELEELKEAFIRFKEQF
jgi:uncharacterized protein YceH (UPF0502 family)